MRLRPSLTPMVIALSVGALVAPAALLAHAAPNSPDAPRVADDVPGQTRIVGGTQAAEGEWPYAVRVKAMTSETGGFVCGGTLVSPDIVLTAQHCMEGDAQNGDIKFIYADIGQVDWKKAKEVGMRKKASSMSQVVKGPGPKKGDWAVVKLDEKVWVSKYATFVTDTSLDRSPSFRAYGWGKIATGGESSQMLLQVDLPLARDAQCTNAPDVEICAGGTDEGGKDTCQGDSGGPLFAKRGSEWVQAGITSWGIGCARPKMAGHYTKVSRFSRDILNAIDKLGGMRPGTTIPKPNPSQPAPSQPAPTQPAPQPTQPAPWPTQPAPQPTQPAPWPTQPAPQPTQPAPWPTQPKPTQPAPWPTQPAPQPTQPAPWPTQSAPQPTQPAPQPAPTGGPTRPRPTWPNPFPGQPRIVKVLPDGRVWESID